MDIEVLAIRHEEAARAAESEGNMALAESHRRSAAGYRERMARDWAALCRSEIVDSSYDSQEKAAARIALARHEADAQYWAERTGRYGLVCLYHAHSIARAVHLAARELGG